MGQQVDIQIPSIEKALNSFSQQPTDKKQVKACLFNLVIYVHETRLVHYMQDLVNTILDKFPCRIIFIQGDAQPKQSYLRVTTANVISGSGQSGAIIACDQITIQASKDQLFRVPYLVIPHFVPDLPVFLLWGQNPFEEKDIFPTLQPFANRLIFDSECALSLGKFCQEVEKSLKNIKMETMDINWALISNWRDVLSSLFSNPDRASDLYSLKSIIISYNDNRNEFRLHPEIRAIYLQGWLASRLAWKYRTIEKNLNCALISYYSTYPVVVALYPQTDPELPSGAITAMEITTVEGRSYTISRKPKLSQVVVHVSSKEVCEMPFTLPILNVHRGLNFMKEIFFGQLGTQYNEMLKSISQINYKIFSE